MLKLFAVQLGGRADGCNTELHDTVFVIGESLESTYPQLVKKWFGNKQRLHIDSSVELTYADGYNISVIKEKPRESTGLNLYFVNFGAYKTNFFGEIHQVNFYVAEKKSAAVKKAKEELCLGLLQQHCDDNLSIDDITVLDQIDEYYIHLTPAIEVKILEIESNYRKLDKAVNL